jgi:hypothetical protein
LIRRRVILVLCSLLLLLLSGCLRAARIGSVTAQVYNIAGELYPEACMGGLRALVRVSNVVLFDQTVAAGQEAQKSTAELPGGSAGLVYQGAPITAKVWCLGEGGDEVGYAEAEGTLNINIPASGLVIVPHNTGDPAQCVEGIRRGRFPCIFAPGLE